MTDDEKYNHLKEIMDLKLENAEKALILQRESYEYRHRHLESKLDLFQKWYISDLAFYCQSNSCLDI